MDDYMIDLLGVDAEKTLRFFIDSLGEVSLPRGAIFSETCYVGNVLAHWAQTSRGESDWALSGNLASFFETFFLGSVQSDLPVFPVFCENDPKFLEIVGSQVLLFAGFFRDQSRHRHNLSWYDSFGQSVYDYLGEQLSGEKQHVVSKVAEHFPEWTRTCCHLSRRMRENRYLLKL